MEYREIVAVTGLSGLYQLAATKSDGAIVRSVADKTTKFISARQHNVTPLESIEVYTIGDNVRLEVVFQKMKDNDETLPAKDVKTSDGEAIKAYFKNIFPEFDLDRVYVSDMKKMLKWFEILKANDLLNFSTEEEDAASEAETTTEEAAPVEEPKEEVKPKKAAKKKKADTDASDDAAKPAKNAAPKKKTEE